MSWNIRSSVFETPGWEQMMLIKALSGYLMSTLAFSDSGASMLNIHLNIKYLLVLHLAVGVNAVWVKIFGLASNEFPLSHAGRLAKWICCLQLVAGWPWQGQPRGPVVCSLQSWGFAHSELCCLNLRYNWRITVHSLEILAKKVSSHLKSNVWFMRVWGKELWNSVSRRKCKYAENSRALLSATIGHGAAFWHCNNSKKCTACLMAHWNGFYVYMEVFLKKENLCNCF